MPRRNSQKARLAVVAGCVAVAAMVAPRPARADDDAPTEPITVLIAEAKGGAHHVALLALADQIAHAQGIDRAAQAQAWQDRTRDAYLPATTAELDEAAGLVERTCWTDGTAPPSPHGDTAAVTLAAAILARAAGNPPDGPRAPYYAWDRFAGAARLAARCLDRDSRSTRTATVLASMFRSRAAGTHDLPAIYVDGLPADARLRGDTVEFDVPADRDALVHVRCRATMRCSPLVRIPAGEVVPAPLALVDLDVLPIVGDALTLTYASAYARSERVGRDASSVATALGPTAPPGGASLVVMDEGSEVRLVLSDRDGAPRGTLRASWADAADAARRLIAGESGPSIGAPRDGMYTIILRELPGAPRLATGATRFDGRPIGLRQYCRGSDCRFAAPPGPLQVTLRRAGLGNDELVRSLEVDADLDVTVVPGRRYAAKYIGEGLMITGGSAALGTAVAMGLLNKAGQSVCSAATSGPDDCENRSFTSDTAATVFFSGVGTVAIGAFLYFVVHKRPSLRIRKLRAEPG
ncbi:MAG: hypothetical protein JNK64_15650 [Myxococcales bacterium]|nr:hypothetical protein [Myxococcales bacterium]